MARQGGEHLFTSRWNGHGPARPSGICPRRDGDAMPARVVPTYVPVDLDAVGAVEKIGFNSSKDRRPATCDAMRCDRRPESDGGGRHLIARGDHVEVGLERHVRRRATRGCRRRG
jgi:hypothetical protein